MGFVFFVLYLDAVHTKNQAFQVDFKHTLAQISGTLETPQCRKMIEIHRSFHVSARPGLL